MFIELTEYLRCPSGHGDEYLVLAPDEMRGRDVFAGTIGCPVCRREFPISGGVARLGMPALPSTLQPVPAPADLQAFLDVHGPGGYVGLVGSAAAIAGELADLLAEIHLVLVNAGSGPGDARVSRVENDTGIPLRSGVLRGLVVGAEYADQWPGEPARAVLRGRRVVLLGEPAALPQTLRLLAAEGGVTVAERA